MWPQFRTIQEKEVTILSNKKCNQFYHKFSKVPSMVQIVDSQMVCAEDSDREHFCYVSAPLRAPSPPRVHGQEGCWGAGQWGWKGKGQEHGGRGEREGGAVGRRGVGTWHERGKMNPSEGGSPESGSRGHPPGRVVGGCGRDVLRGPCLSLSWGRSPSSHTWPPDPFCSATPPHRR